MSVVTLAADEAVQKDLGVSGDKASKLTSLRDDLNAARTKEYQTAGINPQDFQNRTNEQRQKMAEIGRKLDDEFNPKVKEVLSADQFKRLQQIQLQANLAFGGPVALNAPEVDSQLKLTEDQKQKLMAINMEFQQKHARSVYRRRRRWWGGVYKAPRGADGQDDGRAHAGAKGEAQRAEGQHV